MTLLDAVCLAILTLSTVFALFRGLTRELVGLVAVVGGLLLAALFHSRLVPLVPAVLESPPLRAVVAFLGVFLGVWVLAELIIWLVHRLLKAVRLSTVDRLLGGVFGLVRGWLVCTGIVLALTAFPYRLDVVRESALAPYLVLSAQVVAWAVPPSLRAEFERHRLQLQQGWAELLETYRDRLPGTPESGPAR